ncbi:MAG: hypothetical protein NC541_14785 [bacterium]|nr:hypothetical protein [bacterium]
MEIKEKKIEFSLIRLDSRFALKVCGEGLIPVSDYKIQSSEHGETELCVTIRGVPNELELKASLIG